MGAAVAFLAGGPIARRLRAASAPRLTSQRVARALLGVVGVLVLGPAVFTVGYAVLLYAVWGVDTLRFRRAHHDYAHTFAALAADGASRADVTRAVIARGGDAAPLALAAAAVPPSAMQPSAPAADDPAPVTLTATLPNERIGLSQTCRSTVTLHFDAAQRLTAAMMGEQCAPLPR